MEYDTRHSGKSYVFGEIAAFSLDADHRCLAGSQWFGEWNDWEEAVTADRDFSRRDWFGFQRIGQVTRFGTPIGETYELDPVTACSVSARQPNI